MFEQYSDSGGAHPVTSFEAFNYDLGKGAPITFDTLFKPDTNPLEVLDPIVQREMREALGRLSWSGADNTLGAKVYQDFAITDDAVIFFIGQGMWLPEVAGPQKVSVPRAELASMPGLAGIADFEGEFMVTDANAVTVGQRRAAANPVVRHM